MPIPDINPAFSTPEALIQQTWDAKLRDESATGDIFSQNAGIYDDAVKQVPDAIMMKVKGTTTQTTLGMINRLSEQGEIGSSGEVRGNEEAQVTRQLVVKANEWMHGVPTAKYGIEKVKQNPYKIYAMTQPQLSLWAKEMKGMKIRQALCEKADAAQTALVGAGGLGVASVLSPNFSFGGGEAVAYDPTYATFQASIVAASATSTELDKSALDKIEQIASSTYGLEQVTVNGKLCWVLTIPTRQKYNLRKPGTGSYLELLKDGDVRGANNKALSGVLGQYGSLVLVEDQRSPIMVNTAGTLSFEYKGPGLTDDRTMVAAATNWDVGFLLGKGAIVDYEIEPLHFEDEVQNYNRNWGIGAFTTQGYTRADYNDLLSLTDMRNQSSALVCFKTN